MKNPFELTDEELFNDKEYMEILKKKKYEDHLDRVCNFIYWNLGF